jgi:hypothetical protein
MSLWAISDRGTSEIMKFFYEEIKAGRPKSDALKNAKLKYIELADENTADPFYWSAFTLIGDNEPIRIQKPVDLRTFSFTILAICISGIIMFYLYKKKVFSF